MSNLKDRIKERKAALGIKTDVALGKKAGIRHQDISKILSGKIKNPSAGIILSLAVALETTVEYLLTGAPPPGKNIDITVDTKDTPYFTAPVVGEIAAGRPRHNYYAEVDDYVILHKSVKRRAGGGEIFAARVKGDSMEPLINDGDLVACSRTIGKINKNRLYCVRDDEGGITVKRVQEERDSLLLKPVNPDSDVQIVKLKKSEKSPIIGRVVGAWKHF